jgi:RNA polymerase primary sigma factor
MRQLKITKSITNRESQSLDKYLQDIGREELITAEEEVELARKINSSKFTFRCIRCKTIPKSGFNPSRSN